LISSQSGKSTVSKALNRISDDAKRSGFLWLAAETALVRKALFPEVKHDTAWAEQLCSEEQLVSLSGSTVSGNDWERSLKALLSIGSSDISSKETIQKQSRLLWFLSGKETNLGIPSMYIDPLFFWTCEKVVGKTSIVAW